MSTVALSSFAKEKIWYDKPSYDKAERQYFERMAKVRSFVSAARSHLTCSFESKLSTENGIKVVMFEHAETYEITKIAFVFGIR